jgi:DNA processing protein
MNESLTQLAFGGLSPMRIDRLVDRFVTYERVVAAISRHRVKVADHPREMILHDASGRRRQLDDLGVELVFADASAFPHRLLSYEGHPRWLFTRGSGSSQPSLGIVGTRSCTAYGLELAELYGRVAAQAGWSVVSGLARGVDGAAHRGAVNAGGHCHAVLGSGIDVIYPASHRGLYHTILDAGGMISSEFPPGTPPEAWRFPTRNRIIAGCSDVLLVVEAGVKGGALITARIALEYGVPVYAVPGDVDRSTSTGTNLLIRDGAFPVLGPEDLAQVLDLLSPLYT